MTVKIESVSTDEIKTISGTNDRGAYSFRVQQLYLHSGSSHYPLPFKMNHYGDTPNVPPGKHELTDDSFYVDKAGKLAVSAKFK
jgi:hypothetical protein